MNTDGCIIWSGGKYPNGYGRTTTGEYAHRVAWSEANGGVIPTGMFVCHSCDNPVCVNPAHLWIGTNADNVADRDRKGRTARGSRIASAVLSEAEVEQIRRLRKFGLTYTRIAEMYGVTDRNVSSICRFKSWKTPQPALGLVSERVGQARVA